MIAFYLSDAEKRQLLECVRETISAEFSGIKPNYKEATETLKIACGAFVTLHEGSELRGCIGRMIGVEPLYLTVRAMARAAAFEDPRFSPLTKEELDEVTIEISVLSPLEAISDPTSVVVGTHGLYITKGWRSGVLLPQVPVEQGWNREEFLRYTCRKAGLPLDAWQDKDTILQVFTAIVFRE